MILPFSLWTMELATLDLKIRSSVTLPLLGLVLRSQFWNLGPNIPPKNAERLKRRNFRQELKKSPSLSYPKRKAEKPLGEMILS